MKLSIIIPVYNEQENLALLHKSLTAVMQQHSYSYEILYVDDGSGDKSFDILKSIHNQDKHARVISFQKNFGQTAALDAGLSHAKGEIVVTMDADLQNDPKDIPLLIQKLEQGYDMISGWRSKRKDPFFTKKLPSLFSNFLVKLLSGVKVHDQGCTLKAYRIECVKDLELYGEMHRFIPLILQYQGYRINEVKVQHHKRKFGRTKYDISRLGKGFLDLMFIKFWFNYSNRPLHYFGGAGILFIVLGFLVGIFNVSYHLFIVKNFGFNVGPLLLLSALFIILGLQLIVMGFLGEVMIRIYYKDKKAPYRIKKILN